MHKCALTGKRGFCRVRHTHTHTRYTKPGVWGSADIKANNRLPTVLILPISYFNTYKCCCRFSILLLPFHWKWLTRRVSPFATAYWLFAHSTANSSRNKWNAAAVHTTWTDLMTAWKHLLRLQVHIHHGLKLLAFTAMAFSATDTSQTRYFFIDDSKYKSCPESQAAVHPKQIYAPTEVIALYGKSCLLRIRLVLAVSRQSL